MTRFQKLNNMMMNKVSGTLFDFSSDFNFLFLQRYYPITQRFCTRQVMGRSANPPTCCNRVDRSVAQLNSVTTWRVLEITRMMVWTRFVTGNATSIKPRTGWPRIFEDVSTKYLIPQPFCSNNLHSQPAISCLSLVPRHYSNITDLWFYFWKYWPHFVVLLFIYSVRR